MGPVLTSSDVADYPTPADLPLAPDAPTTNANHWPATVQMAFAPSTDSAAAQAATWQLAHTHYENFSVVSALLPRRLRQDFCNIYAFCRIADDLGDEISDRDTSLRMLERFRQATVDLYAGKVSTIVFAALQSTVSKYDIPIKPFLDLIDAFEQDQRVDRYQNFDELRDYCRRSADPVGRFVLYVSGYRDDVRQQFSDATCTGLQLANFWQDVRRDLIDRNRIYLPRETMDQFNVTESQLQSGICDGNYRRCIAFEVDRAQSLFDVGDGLLPMLDESVRPQISLFGQGGKAILQAIRQSNFDTLTSRPVLSRWQKGRLVMRGLAGRLQQVLLTSSSSSASGSSEAK
jgi:squalene synthase HpnC